MSVCCFEATTVLMSSAFFETVPIFLSGGVAPCCALLDVVARAELDQQLVRVAQFPGPSAAIWRAGARACAAPRRPSKWPRARPSIGGNGPRPASIPNAGM